MSKDFLFNDIKGQISKGFVNNGWIIVYKNYDNSEDIDFGGSYCALIENSSLEEALSHYDWDLRYGNGKPGFIFHYENGKETYNFSNYYNENVQPLVYNREEFGNRPNYLELAEEFRLYHNLFEDYKDSENKNYIYLDSNGDEEIVAIISKNEVKIKLNFIKDFISAKKMSLLIFFDLMRRSDKSLSELNIKELNETIKGNQFIYSHIINDISEMSYYNFISQSWIMGKSAIQGISDYYPNKYGKIDENDDLFEEYIIGYNDDGNTISFSSDEEKLSNYFGKNPNSPHYLTPVYFNKEVLKKYYDNPHKYSVEDGVIHCIGVWALRLDNSCSDYVVVFLGDLGKLNHKEQLYWKSHNIKPQNGLSYTGYSRAFLGEPADPSTPDLYFKMKYKQFNDKWKAKYGWYLFKPLSTADDHYFISFHLLTSDNNEKEFDEQILSLTKIIIDSLNEEELKKILTTLESNDKGIDKFEKFLKENGLSYPDMIKFIRKLQSLRSTSVAHRRSEKNKEANDTINYFMIGKMSLKEVLEKIIIDTIKIFNTLEKQLL